MTNEERERLEKEYPAINVKRLVIAVGLCVAIMIVLGLFT